MKRKLLFDQKFRGSLDLILFKAVIGFGPRWPLQHAMLRREQRLLWGPLLQMSWESGSRFRTWYKVVPPLWIKWINPWESGAFQKWGYPNSWMVYKGKAHSNR